MGTVNFDAKQEFVINTPKISLGLDAKEHLVLGDLATDWLKEFVDVVRDLINAVQDTTVLTGTGPSSPVKVNNAPKYSPLLTTLNGLENKLQSLLSKQNVTL